MVTNSFVYWNMKQWKHPGKGDLEDQVLIYDRSPRVQSAIILPERKQNTRGLHNAWSAVWFRVQGPWSRPVFQGGGGDKEQNKIKSGFGLNIYPTKSPQSLIGTARNLLKLYTVQDIKLLVA